MLGFALSFVYPWIIGSAVDVIVAPRDPGFPLEARVAALLRLTGFAALTAVGHAIVVYGRGHFNIRLGHGIVADIRRELFDHLQKLSLLFFTRERTGAILARVVHDVHEAASLIYMGLIVAVLDAVQLAIAVALLLSISWKLTLACLVLFPLYGLVFAVMNPRVQRASERMHGQLTRISGNLVEQLSGQALVKTYTAEQREAERFADEVARHHGFVVAQSHEGHLVASFGELLVDIGTTLVVGYGGWLALHGEMTAGTMTRFLGYVLIMFGPVRRFAELNIVYQTSVSAMRRVFRVLEVQPSVVESPRPNAVAPRRGHVRFEAVSFRYSQDSDETRVRLDDDREVQTTSDAGDAPCVLDHVTLEARPGELIAVVGPSGAGKSTLVSLLPRLYDVTAGRVLIDGIDVRDYSLTALRAAIGIVQQDSFIFTGTARENIAYGRPGATDEEVEAAARAASAHEFITDLSDGYDTRLGERGVNLSGGQRQRISIARAILKDPRILILDEATSSLDAENEAVVQRALEVLMRSRTCFVIAHRLSTIRKADRIFVLDAGRVVESGTHRELLARNGAYTRLVRHQAGDG
ncbi:ABC transporter ATP-binding protein [Nannocystis punicea]|uniref:ABC transporter ATP-binding protein n=1 Tax=Nannocystis punicea TaxID=2995304 RepID=A0ABY7GUQ4_9BACT|nr:ABC transporter ATP-binding protein [Nannocystis poenicansa]WAS90668.1 ABC transporter ATP-binding protein [Nannocystis poenicansa]